MEDWYVITVTLILLFILVLLLSVWEYTLDKKYKNTPIINYNQPSQQNKNPSTLLLGANETDSNQNSSGFQTSTLRQACVTNNEESGVPNLPISYTSQCSEGQNCVNSVTKGNICLSKPGYYCKNKMDCDPTTTDECIANICVSRTNKLNAPCNSNSDCFLDTNNTNLSCVQTDSGKRCKYDLYPLGNKCQYDQECFPGTHACVQGPSSNYVISGTANSDGNILLNDGMSLFVYSFVNNIENKKVKLVNNQTGVCSYYKITDFSLENNYSFTPIYYTNTYPPLTINDGVCYNVVFYENQPGENTCIAKINSGAKISSIQNTYLKDFMISLDEPCQSDSTKMTINNETYCVSNTNIKNNSIDSRNTAGTLCDIENSSLGCCSNSSTIPLVCTYSENLTETTENNYNFIGNEDFKSVGRCLVPSGGLNSNCNDFLKGCKKPYLCYEENYGNFCLQPLETQTCYFDDACPEGFSCVNKKCVSSDSNTPNIVSNSFNQDAGLFYFDPTLNKYKKLTILEDQLDNITTLYTGTKLILGQNYNSTNVTKICVYDSVSFDVYIFTYVSEDTYRCKKIHLDYTSQDALDITIDPDDNILVILKENISTARKRSYKIVGTGTSLTLNTTFPNLAIGTSVFYSGTSGTINEQNLYNISGVCGKHINLENVLTYDSNLENNYIITYDNTLSYPDGTFSNQGGIGHCQDNIQDIDYSWVHSGDMFQIKSGTIGISGSLANVGPQVTLDGTSLYFYTYIEKNSDYNYYMISDDYNASEGSAPFIQGNKYIGQSMTYSGACVRLYNNLVSYSLINIDESQTTVTINNSEPYITKTGNSYAKNGTDVGGITYAFDSNTEVKFKTYKYDNKNYFLVHSQIETEVDEANSSNKYINYVQKINYSIGSCWDSNYTYQYKNQSSTSWINFSYQNNALLPHSTNFFDIGVSFNAVTSLYPNTFTVQEDEDFNLYNNITNNDTTQTGTNINIVNESKFRKLESNFDTNNDPITNLTFKNVNNIFKIPPIPMDGNLVSQLGSPGEKDNTFVPNETLLTFNNSKDIDLILKYGSSEIAIVKEVDISNEFSGLLDLPDISPYTMQFPQWVNNNNITSSRRSKIVNVSGNPQIILIITDIVSHEINLNSEKLICKINRPLVDPNTNPTEDWKIDNSFEKYIQDDSSSWKFYTYNYIPLTYRTVSFVFTSISSPGPQPYAFSKNLQVQIFDSSPLYTSCKKNDFFTSSIYNRCSYNKLFFPRKENNNYIVLNNFDGFGLDYDIVKSKNTPLVPRSNQNNYNSNVIFYNGDFPLNTFKLTTTPNTPAVPYFDVSFSRPIYLLTYGTYSNVDNAFDLGGGLNSPVPVNLSYFYPSSNFSFITGNSERDGTLVDQDTLDPQITEQFGYSNLNEIEGYTTNNFINSFNFTTDQINYFNDLWSALKKENKKITTYCSIIGSIYTITLGNAHDRLFKGPPPNDYSYNEKLYTINNLFMSTLNYIDNLGNGKVFYNNQQLLNSLIISSQASSNGKKKNKGSLKLNTDSTAIALQKNSDPVITQLDQTNIDAINWPSWINLLNNNNNKYDHKIESVFYSSGNNNESSKATYYVYTSYVNNLNQKSYQMYYFGVDETSLNRGVTTSSSTSFYTTNNLAMDSLSRRLYLIGNVKI